MENHEIHIPTLEWALKQPFSSLKTKLDTLKSLYEPKQISLKSRKKKKRQFLLDNMMIAHDSFNHREMLFSDKTVLSLDQAIIVARARE